LYLFSFSFWKLDLPAWFLTFSLFSLFLRLSACCRQLSNSFQPHRCQ
jgi:hypothetical protein